MRTRTHRRMCKSMKCNQLTLCIHQLDSYWLLRRGVYDISKTWCIRDLARFESWRERTLQRSAANQRQTRHHRKGFLHIFHSSPPSSSKGNAYALLFMQWTRQISRLADRVGLFQLILSHIILLNHPKLSENLPAEHSRVGCGRRWDRSLCMRINACTKETLFQQLYDRNHEMIKLPLIPFYVRYISCNIYVHRNNLYGVVRTKHNYTSKSRPT